MSSPHWTFLSNYAHVLICLADSPSSTLREVADRVGITERSALRLITHLDEAGILKRVKTGRRNSYLIDTSVHLRHPIEEHSTVGELLGLVLPPARVRRITKNHEEYEADQPH